MADKRSNTFILGGGGSPNLGVRQGSQSPQKESPLTGGEPYRQFNAGDANRRPENIDGTVSPSPENTKEEPPKNSVVTSSKSRFNTTGNEILKNKKNITTKAPGALMKAHPYLRVASEIMSASNHINSLKPSFNDMLILSLCLTQDGLELVLTTFSFGILYIFVFITSIITSILILVIKMFKKDSKLSKFIFKYIIVFVTDQALGFGILPITTIGMLAILISEKLQKKKQ